MLACQDEFCNAPAVVAFARAARFILFAKPVENDGREHLCRDHANLRLVRFTDMEEP